MRGQIGFLSAHRGHSRPAVAPAAARPINHHSLSDGGVAAGAMTHARVIGWSAGGHRSLRRAGYDGNAPDGGNKRHSQETAEMRFLRPARSTLLQYRARKRLRLDGTVPGIQYNRYRVGLSRAFPGQVYSQAM